MIRLDTRSRDVLMVLFQAQNPISVRQIADQLDITPRMMRASLDTIEAWLEARDASLIRKQNSGIQIRATPVQIRQLIDELSNQTKYFLYLSPAERINILVLMLLWKGDAPLLPEKIIPTLGISRPTLLKDAVKARKWLEKFSLALVYKTHNGFEVQGSEVNWREAMVHLYITKLGVIPLLAMGNASVVQHEIKIGLNLDLQSTMLTETLQSLDLKSAHNFVKQLEDIFHQRFVDVAFVRLVCHLALAVSRSSQNKIVDIPNDVPDNLGVGDKAKTIESLLTSSPFFLMPSESKFFIHQVLGAKIQYSLIDILQSRHSLKEQLETQEIVQDIIDAASMYLHPSLIVDQQLIRALSVHIQVAKNRLQFDLPIDNPLKEAIEAQFPYIINVVKKSVASLENHINRPIPAEEIAYIAMHLGAAMERLHPYIGRKRKVWIVCAEGTATAWLLVARLQAEFPEIVVDEVSSVLEITQYPPQTGQVDLVLTTLPLVIPHVLTLEVNPLLTPDDRARIHTALNQTPQRKSVSTYVDQGLGLSLSSLITNETIQLGLTVENWEDVVDAAGNLLQNVQATSSRYTEAMKEVIYRYGPYVVFAPGVALLHARSEDGVNRICMSLVTLDPPIPFHHLHNDPVKVAFALCVVDHRSHLKAMTQLANLLRDVSRLSRIESATSTAEVLTLLTQET
jgi:transcriptional antiterminator/mannitol/fructose-specific phosphotransferase system IIA component (Ntr-type)